MRKILLIITLLFSTLQAEVTFENTLEDTNFALNSKIASEAYLYDYNRLRYTSDIYSGDFSTKVIIDNETLIGNKYLNSSLGKLASVYTADVPFDITTKINDNPYDRLKLYRAFVQYEGDKHAFTIGLQRVAFGVGRIWTPVDMFNPLQSISLESGERAPVFAARYGYALGDTSTLTAVLSEQADKNIKGAFRLKFNTGFADLAAVYVKEKNRELIGYEAAGALYNTGFELRSEGGSYTDTTTNTTFTKLIVGTDYSFENSLTLIAEYLYNENQTGYAYNPLIQSYSVTPDAFSDVINQKDRHYLAVMASYQFSTLLSGFLLAMNNLVDGSLITISSLNYSLSDESNLILGGFVSAGASNSEFTATPNLIYLNYSITF